MVAKATKDLKMILLVLTITITRVWITEGTIKKITEGVMKKILTVMKMTYKGSSTEKTDQNKNKRIRDSTWTRYCQIKSHENIFYWSLPALKETKKLKYNDLKKK